MSRNPKIAVLLDENTSADSTRYEAHKGYFRCINDAGGLPYGIPYLTNMIRPAVAEFDGFLAVGGGFAYPEELYIKGTWSPYKESERFEFEKALMRGFLDAGKPVLGICAGMQMLACLHGAKLHGDVQGSVEKPLPHYSRDVTHPVALSAGSKLAAACGRDTLDVNSFHKEAVGEPGPRLLVVARAPDGVIEAIEAPERRFAVGLQWHQERYAGLEHPGQGIFEGFVGACRA